MASDTKIIVVQDTQYDEKGYLVVTDKGGGTTKVPPKGKAFHDVFQPGLAVEVMYTHFEKDGKSLKYVSGARQVKDSIPPTSPSNNAPVVFSPAPSKATPIDDKNKTMTLSYAKDLICAKIGADAEFAKKSVADLVGEVIAVHGTFYSHVTGNLTLDDAK